MAAEAETGGERTEEPSQKRLQDARDRGQLPRSRELTNFATMIGGSATLLAIGGVLSARLSQMMRRGLAIDPQQLRDPDGMFGSLSEACMSALTVLLPVFGALIALVVLAALALGGWNFSMQAMAPDFSRLSPLAGMKRLFGLRGASELGKALLKCAVVGGVCAAIVSSVFGDVLALAHMEPRTAIGRGAGLVSWAFVWLCASLALIAMVDVPLQLFQFKRALRMTRQELRDEAKESDGRPETKQRIRQMQQTLARRRMMHKVPTADVVIVNPTHFAVALKYDPKKMRAPRVLAKGVDLVAQNIRRIAAEHRVPVFESPKLARALYRSTDLNKEIPAGLYVAVAQVLSYIFRVRTLNPTVAARVARPDPQVSDEYEAV
ncbi:MAG TPA: flagellar biosynthesis protein FlhB [Steroidobacteraceae bacterium]|jgi:flagellar biosynthetic protein FlhB|nr:flagellar biosynthesis protein FlhB [Steroidobacteraceae bacterium]